MAWLRSWRLRYPGVLGTGHLPKLPARCAHRAEIVSSCAPDRPGGGTRNLRVQQGLPKRGGRDSNPQPTDRQDHFPLVICRSGHEGCRLRHDANCSHRDVSGSRHEVRRSGHDVRGSRRVVRRSRHDVSGSRHVVRGPRHDKNDSRAGVRGAERALRGCAHVILGRGRKGPKGQIAKGPNSEASRGVASCAFIRCLSPCSPRLRGESSGGSRRPRWRVGFVGRVRGGRGSRCP